MEGNGPEIVERPNPNKGLEIAQLVPFKTLAVRRRAAAQAGLDSFSVLNGPGGHYIRDGKKYMVPKNMARIRVGWDEITDQAKIAAYRKIEAKLLAEQRAKQK